MVHDRKDSFKLTLQLSVVPAYGGARFECFIFLLALHVCSRLQAVEGNRLVSMPSFVVCYFLNV